MKCSIYITFDKAELTEISIQNCLKQDLDIEWKKKFFKIPSKYINEVELQYGTKLSKLLAIYLGLKNLISIILRNPKLGLKEIFVGYEGKFEIANWCEFPLQILYEGSSKLTWISRDSIVKGIVSNVLGADIELNRLRYSHEYRIFIWNLRVVDRNNSEKNRIGYRLKTESVELNRTSELNSTSIQDGFIQLNLHDCVVQNGTFIRLGKVVYSVDRDATLEQFSWPTNLIFHEKDSYKVIRSFVYRSSVIQHGIFLGSSSSWFHFLVEIFPRFLLLERNFPSSVTAILSAGTPEPIIQVLKLIGISEFCLVHDGEEIKINHLLTALDSRFEKRFDFESRRGDLLEVRNFFRRMFVLPKHENFIFIKRQKSLLRPMIGQKFVEKYMSTLGFKVIIPELMTLSEQLSVFRNAKIVVGESGAALTSMLLMPKNALVIEISPWMDKENFWLNFARVVGIRHERFIGHPCRILNFFSGLGFYFLNIFKFRKFIEKQIRYYS